MKIFFWTISSILFLFKSEKLKVHLIPHSHQDPGWLTTIEGYYTGETSPSGECVKCVIERVFSKLLENKNLVFTWAELAFLLIWQKTASDEEKNTLKQFLSTKQIDFVNGGYVTNDEACSYYEDVIEQLTYGNRFLKEEYDYIPTTAWHIDPFGHSGTVASIFAQAGFDAFFIERSNEEEMRIRSKNKKLEFIWNPSGSGNYILTHYNNLKYGGLDKTGYCLKSLCNSWHQNLNKLAEWFIDQKDGYPYNLLLLHIGKDFSFGFPNDRSLFEEIEVLASRLNNFKHEEYEFEAFLSTPSNYTKDFFEEYDQNPNFRLDVKESDNFPYIEIDDHYRKKYWTGYFTSRPQIKLIMRQSGYLLQTYRKLFSSIFLSNEFNDTDSFSFYDISKALDGLEQTVSLAQHHDGISGTAKSWVERDYVDKLFNARQLLNFYLNRYFNEKQELKGAYFIHCPQNISFSMCNNSKIEDENAIILNIFNPGSSEKRIVKAKIPNGKIKISSKTSSLNPDIFCFDSIYSKNDCEIIFEDYFLIAETKTYKIANDEEDNRVKGIKKNEASRIEISESAWIEIKSLNPLKLEHKYCENQKCIQEEFTLDYLFYRSSGDSAYILWTLNGYPEQFAEFIYYIVFEGNNFVYIIFKDNRENVQARISFNRNNPKAIKLFTELAPLDLETNPRGIEVILQITSNIKNEGKFKTDSNGLLLNERRREEDQELSRIAKNYYPVNSQISIEDEKRKLVIMNDRAQGGASLNDGQVELMIHRRVMSSGQGIGEYLDDKEPNSNKPIKVSTEHTIMILESDSLDESIRDIQYENENSLFIMYGINYSGNETLIPLPYPKPQNSLPSNLKFSIRPYYKREFIIRLVNLNEKTSIEYIFNTMINGILVNTLLSSISTNKMVKVIECEEVSINTIHKKKEMNKRKFREIKQEEPDKRSQSIDSLFLKPLEIRTFLLKVDLVESVELEHDHFRLRNIYGN